MISTLLGIALYVALHCAANKLHPIDYIREHWMLLGILGTGCMLLTVLPAPAMVATVTALAMPMLAAYSLPSLMAKAGHILAQVRALLNV